MAVLRQECRRYTKGVDEAAWARPVAYFAPVAPDFAEAGELKDDNLAVTQRILDARGVPNGMAG